MEHFFLFKSKFKKCCPFITEMSFTFSVSPSKNNQLKVILNAGGLMQNMSLRVCEIIVIKTLSPKK